MRHTFHSFSIYLTNLERRGILGANSGLITYNKKSPVVQSMIVDWINRCESSLIDSDRCDQLIARCGIHSFMHDELVVTSVCDDHEVEELRREDNYLFLEKPINPLLDCELHDAKSIHFKADYFSSKNRAGLILSFAMTRKHLANMFEFYDDYVSLDNWEDLLKLTFSQGIKFC